MEEDREDRKTRGLLRYNREGNKIYRPTIEAFNALYKTVGKGIFTNETVEKYVGEER